MLHLCDWSQDLSLHSFGQSAVFLIGGPTKAFRPSAIYLHSGDIMVMSGPSRLAYHAVPKIVLVDEQPWNNTLNNDKQFETQTNCKLMENAAEDNDIAASVKQKTSTAIKIRNCCNISDEEDKIEILNYMKNSRININVRQVLLPSMDSLPES